MAIRTERCAVEIATPPDGYTLATRLALCVHSRGWSPKRRWRSGREAPTLDAEDLTSFAVAKRLAGVNFRCSRLGKLVSHVGNCFLLGLLFVWLISSDPCAAGARKAETNLQYGGRLQVRRLTKLNGKHGKGFHGDLTRIEHTVRSG
ncbi:myosin-4 [Trichinella spiralis]|uniref:myosin-4 n=1 Tax=Trichinella spiralis TaxID=6334 RepID=UPI0001EFB3F3|nr:myosin-4 [Trichinella spiralis]